MKLCGNDPAYCRCGNIHNQEELDAATAKLRKELAISQAALRISVGLAHHQPSPPPDGLAGADVDKIAQNTAHNIDTRLPYGFTNDETDIVEDEVRAALAQVEESLRRSCEPLVKAYEQIVADLGYHVERLKEETGERHRLQRVREPLVALVQEWEHRARAIREAPDSIKNGYIRGTLVATNAHAEELRAALTNTEKIPL